MSWSKCDSCGESAYTADNPFVEYRQPRPSDPSDMCCTLAGHFRCFSPVSASLPQISADGGVATPAQWREWIEGEGALLGFAFLG